MITEEDIEIARQRMREETPRPPFVVPEWCYDTPEKKAFTDQMAAYYGFSGVQISRPFRIIFDPTSS